MSLSKLGLETENKRLYKIIEDKEERIEDLLERLDEVTKGYQKLLMNQHQYNPITGVNTNEND
jgi:hypothetical protein